MSLDLQRLLTRSVHPAERPLTGQTEVALNISVVFTSVASTLAALRQAGDLAASLGARITLLVPQVVPYPLPLNRPPVAVDGNEARLRVIAGASRVETSVCTYLCRDPLETLMWVLKPHSLVVVGGGRKWWPTSEKRLASKLRRAGHEVIIAEGK
jgi:hypothetical protein